MIGSISLSSYLGPLMGMRVLAPTLPVSSAVASVTIFIVEPGSYTSSKALFLSIFWTGSWSAERHAMARIAMVRASISTTMTHLALSSGR